MLRDSSFAFCVVLVFAPAGGCKERTGTTGGSGAGYQVGGGRNSCGSGTMRTSLVRCAVVMIVVALAAAGARGDALDGLRSGHPRLVVLDADLAGVREAVKADDTARRWHGQLVAEAEKLLDA